MIDPDLIRKNPEKIKEYIKNRFQDERIVDEFLKKDQDWRKKSKELDEKRKLRNGINKEIAERIKKKENYKELKEKAKGLDEEIEKLEDKVKKLNEIRINTLYRIPNILSNVPIAKDESKNVIIKKWGKPREDEVPDHEEILTKLKQLDVKKASEVSGARFYYLKDKLVKLNLALINFGFDFLIKKGYKPIWVPFAIREKYMKGAAELLDFKETLYKIKDEDLYLIPSAEQAIVSYHANEILQEGNLPLKYVGFSTNFRKEAGAHGKDTKGIFRVHQFDKIEQIIFSLPEDSWKFFEELNKNTQEIYQKLGLPYRVVNIVSGELNNSAARKYDIEVWMPSQKKYREVGSCSNCLDYQARNLMIRVSRNKGIEYLHTLNCTGIATERTIVAIVENYYKDGKITIPKVLRKYTGFDEI